MATKATAMIKARERARKAAQAAQEREKDLIERATGFFAESALAESVAEEVEERIRVLREQAVVDREAHLVGAAEHAQAMVDTGAAVSDVASRLELTPAALRKVLALAQNAKDDSKRSTTDQLPDQQGPGQSGADSVSAH